MIGDSENDGNMKNAISDAINMERETGLKPINSEVYMKKRRSSHLTVYCFRKWDSFWLQLHHLKHLTCPTFDKKARLSETVVRTTAGG